MRLQPHLTALAGALIGLSLLAAPAAAENMAHAHMNHVLKSWQDTPDQAGLLPTAEAEAETAAQHIGFALQKPDDLDWMQMHVIHVRNALDPSVEPKGPGMGYGVKRAASGIAKHIGFAAEAPEATANIKTHAVHVATAAENVVHWTDMAIAESEKVAAAQTAAEAKPAVEKIAALVDAIRNGRDADGDGQATWVEGEGGLAQVEKHMGFMAKGEGM
jgi:hypothetical protein